MKKGVDPTKLVIVPQPVDLEVFNPAAVTQPFQLPGTVRGLSCTGKFVSPASRLQETTQTPHSDSCPF